MPPNSRLEGMYIKDMTAAHVAIENDRQPLHPEKCLHLEEEGQRGAVGQPSVSGPAGPFSASVAHALAIPRKCRCRVGLRTSPTSCMHSAAKRKHRSSRFRSSELDKLRLFVTPMLQYCTTSLVLSVVHATERQGIVIRTFRGITA
jgi:hypothetical protein